ncbi:hypothetical protein GCM10025783_28350 [Amnibacterium soli]|uniref:Glycosyltransferase family 1 protein n=1 Tax=Amnibacterium soli TaxID=1282736 RepID=A0ABP8ZDZ0_9MICO
MFVIYPRGLRTGGPEALHQLVDSLRRQGQDAYLTPRAASAHLDRVGAYSVYDAPEAPVEDAPDCAVVSPEDEPGELLAYRSAVRFCWWLSIDNSSPFRDSQALRHAWSKPDPGLLLRLKMYARVPYHGVRRRLRGETTLLNEIHHLAQSQFAWSFLHSRLGVLPTLLTDYTPLEGFSAHAPLAPSQRGRTVTYNPYKSGFLIDRLAERLPDVRFIPLENLTRDEVVATLQSSALYLDLGHHPGKDRLPREAALCDAIVAVARRGAGAFWADVPLSGGFKVAPGPAMLEETVELVQRVLADPDSAWHRQDGYREFIRGERERFDAEALDVFLRGRLGEGAVAA